MLESLSQKVTGVDRPAPKNNAAQGASKSTDNSSRPSDEKSFETVMNKGQGGEQRAATATKKTAQTPSQDKKTATKTGGETQDEAGISAKLSMPGAVAAEALVVQATDVKNAPADGEETFGAVNVAQIEEQEAQSGSIDLMPDNAPDPVVAIGVAPTVSQVAGVASADIEAPTGPVLSEAQHNTESHVGVGGKAASLADVSQQMTELQSAGILSDETPQPALTKSDQMLLPGAVGAVATTKSHSGRIRNLAGQLGTGPQTAIAEGNLQAGPADSDLSDQSISSGSVANAQPGKVGPAVVRTQQIQSAPPPASVSAGEISGAENQGDADVVPIRTNETTGGSKATIDTTIKVSDLSASNPLDAGGDNSADATMPSDVDVDVTLTDVKSLETTSARTEITAHMKTELPRHIALQLADVARTHQNRAVELTLSPEELGRLRLTFSGDMSAMTVSVNVERPETLDLMRRHIDILAQEMRDIGYGDVSFSFEQSGFGAEGSFGREENDGASLMRQDELPPISAQPEAIARVNLSSSTGVDIRL